MTILLIEFVGVLVLSGILIYILKKVFYDD